MTIVGAGLVRAALAGIVCAGAGAPVPADFAVRAPGGPARTFSLVDLAERARPAVVHVRATLVGRAGDPRAGKGARPPAGVLSVGSGFFVAPAGLVATNEHVVRGAGDIRVRLFDGRDLAVCVVGADEMADVALLRVQGPGPFVSLAFGDSNAVKVGQAVVAIGSLFGFSHSMTAGVISAKERVVERTDGQTGAAGVVAKDGAYSFFLQTDAAINVGSSGGPLLDMSGAVIGVNAAFWGGVQPVQGASFAIPGDIARLILRRLLAEGQAPRSYLGVDGQVFTPALAAALGIERARGALIARVEPGSAAAAAGLAIGDVVVEWNGQSLAGNEDFKIYAQLTPPGTPTRLKILRDGRPRTLALTTRADTEGTGLSGPHPAACRSGDAAGSPVARRHPGDDGGGIEVADLPAARARGLPGDRGVEVVHAIGRAADEADLRPGDIILRVGETAVVGESQLRELLERARPSQALPLLVRRQGWDFWTVLPPREPAR